MAELSKIEPQRTALLVMDVQSSTVRRYKEQSEAYLARLSELIAAVRSAGVRVIYVIVSFRAGYLDVSTRNLMFGALKHGGWPNRSQP